VVEVPYGSVAWMMGPGARAANAGIVARVSGAGAMVPGAGVALTRAKILHFAIEVLDAIQNPGVVRCWGYACERSRGDGFDDMVCVEGLCVQLNLGHSSKGDLDVGW
jgi:hypothetical protein